MTAFEDAFIKTLKNAFRLDLKTTRYRYNELSFVLFFGVGIVSVLALLLVPWFDYKSVIYSYTAYCFLITAFIKFRSCGITLGVALWQVPLGLTMIVSLLVIMPLDMLYLTGFLFPILFIFVFEFHHRRYTRWVFAVGLATSAVITSQRGLPYWQAYLVTTFGSTLIIGRVVETATHRIMDLANNDALTGLINRRHWEERLSHMVSLNKRDKNPVTLVFMDLDDFKKVNDEFGHAAGDQLLISVAEQLKELCRDTDLLGRWGGDEFGIVLPHVDRDHATLFVQRLRAKLHNTGISAGVVTLREGESMEEFLSRADKAMYRDKETRKGTIDDSVSVSI